MRHGMKPLDKKAADRSFRGSQKKKRGFFVEIQDHLLTSITRKYIPHPDDDEDEIDIGAADKSEAFARLFPGCTTESPSAEDVAALCEVFRLKMVDLEKDRHKNRAHPLEGDAGTATMLFVKELDHLFDYTLGLLDDLSTLCSGGAYDHPNMNHADHEETAADVVDLILLGNIADVKLLTARRTRDELYAELHAIDDAARGGEEDRLDRRHFNDRQFTSAFEDWLAVVAAR
jgi:hypothetical protein